MLTKTCERCDGNGEIHNIRDARIDELTDAQTKVLLHADIYRETGGEEAKKEQERARRMQRQGAGGPSRGQQPNPRPTNMAGSSAFNQQNL